MCPALVLPSKAWLKGGERKFLIQQKNQISVKLLHGVIFLFFHLDKFGESHFYTFLPS